MGKDATIGVVVPFAEDRVPDEGLQMYPTMRFVPRGVGVRSLTPDGYAAAFDGIIPAAENLAARGVDAIMVIGTSLTFYRGPEAHDRLLVQLRARTGLPVSTMSAAIIEGLRAVGAKRIAVATAYTDLVNRRLTELLEAAGLKVLALECFNLLGFGEPGSKSERDIIALSEKAVARASEAEGVLISCGGQRTLGVAKPLRWKKVGASRLSPARRRRSGPPCGWSARAARLPVAAGCSNRRQPLCINLRASGTNLS
jgi:arylmalonate decarboxylase